MRICIVGAGPAGLFLAGRLLKKNPKVVVNLLDARLTPFGLIRYGVAPDHPEVKSCASHFNETLRSPNVSLFGGVKIGGTIGIKELKDLHDAVIVCTGMPKPRLLGVPGESLQRSYTCSQIVGWYTGDPEHLGQEVPLEKVKKVAIIGQGNVALDVARLLLKPWTALQHTEISPDALEGLKNSAVKEVDIIGRRGPLQMSFTIAELREMFDLPDTGFQTDHRLVTQQLDNYEGIWRDNRPAKRILELLKNKSASTADTSPTANRLWRLKYFLNPKKIVGDTAVEAVEFEEMMPAGNVVPESWGSLRNMKAVGTKKFVTHPYDMIISCVGYISPTSFGLPADSAGVIKNVDGRVVGHPGVYVSGWASTGPKGELASTMHNAKSTADLVLGDLQSKSDTAPIGQKLEEFLQQKSVPYKILDSM